MPIAERSLDFVPRLRPVRAREEVEIDEQDDQLEEDRRLWRELSAGDEGAFETFFHRHYQGIFRFALARVRDQEVAADLAQNTLCAALRKLESYRGDALLVSWLRGICRFEISGFLRQQARRPQSAPLDENTAAGSSIVENPERQALKRESASWVHETIDLLPPHYGEILELKYADRLPVVEIAQRLGASAKATESLLGRARRAFKIAFARLSGETSEDEKVRES